MDMPRSTAPRRAAPRFAFLDSMRGFAAAWVVIFHLNEVGTFTPSVYQSFVKAGSLGVPIFFVLSGYAIHSSLLRGPQLLTFLRRRFFRIYPPYFASLVLVMAVVVYRKLTFGDNDLIAIPHDVVGWIATLTLTTKPVTSTPVINWVYWTLSYEAAFYLWLTIALIAPRLRWPILFAPSLLSLIWHAAPVFFIDQWCLFALGAAIAEWQREPKLLVLALVATCLLDAVLHRTTGEALAAVISAALVLMALSSRFAWLNREAVLSRAGIWSYSLYLVHVPMGVWLALKVDPYPRVLSARNLPVHLAIDAFAMAVSCGAAWLFWRMIENPAQRFAHRKAVAPRSEVALEKKVVT